jgi:hypothetical protein
MTTDLLAMLRELEEALHSNEVRRNPERLDQLLHPEFEEIGRSGARYNRTEMVEALLEGGEIPEVASRSYTASLLTEDAALLNYDSALVDQAGKLYRKSRRSSLWLRSANVWRLRFHQGTPTNEK